MTNQNLKLDNEKISAAIEALLFIYGEPLEIKRMAALLKVEKNVVEEALKEIENGCLIEGRGLKLIFSGESAQIVAKPDFSPLLEGFVKEDFKEELSSASLETLSLIAYFCPVSRPQIDYFRGVNSSFILRNLMIRGLVERFDDQHRKNVYLYRPSFDLLKYLGVSRVEELPEYEKFREMKNEIR